jgi:hypothetical protein
MVQKDVQYAMKFAMKNKDAKKRDFLRVVLGEFTRISKDVTDQEALDIINKMHKNAKELKNDYEMKVLSEWMPKQLSEEELTRIIANIIADNEYTEMSDLGKIMQGLKKHSGVDMKFASKCAKELIAGDKI